MNCRVRSVGPGGAEGSGKGGIKQERRTCGRVGVESSWSRLLGGKGKFGRISKATGFMSVVTVAQRSERPGGVRLLTGMELGFNLKLEHPLTRPLVECWVESSELDWNPVSLSDSRTLVSCSLLSRPAGVER